MKKISLATLALIFVLALIAASTVAQGQASCDKDGDGFKSTSRRCGGTDCDDSDPNTFPGAMELCDGKDNNCDGVVDEGCGGGCGNGTCDAGENCLSCQSDCGACPDVNSIDAAGDSITKAFNAQSKFPCPNTDQEHLNWCTSDTHGNSFCSDGGEGVFSHAETLECFASADIIRAEPNSARSGAKMDDFVEQSNSIRNFLSLQPSPRYATVLLGHNDICGGTVDKVQPSCPAGSDQDPNNYCRTTPEAFEREFRKGLDILITVPDLKIGVASILRVSLLCNQGKKRSCGIVGRQSCQQLWKNAVGTGFVFGADKGICGSLTADCSKQRISDAYQTGKAYRDILASVTAEYAGIPEGGTSQMVFVGGQNVGGVTKLTGVTLVFSNASWVYKFKSDHLSCCDCFHPSILGQDTLSRLLFEGLTCSSTDVCCQDTGDALTDGKCGQEDTSGTIYPGFFSTKR